MKILLDLVAPSLLEVAWYSGILPVVLVGAVVAVAAVLIIKAVKKRK